MLKRSVGPPRTRMSGAMLGGRRPWAASAVVMVTVPLAGLSLAPSALADSGAALRDEVAVARGETPCGPLQYDPIVEQTAEVINRSTDDYLNQTATQVPIDDPLPGLNDLGHGAGKATVLQGADRSVALAVKGLVLQGYAALPDCSYTDFGVSVLRNEATGYQLAAVVLAGP